MAVIGAKLSEGLNFSDDLVSFKLVGLAVRSGLSFKNLTNEYQARAVVVVGLPFPNINSPELQERMKYVNKLSKEAGSQKDAGRELYENLCMNAVNQSIGEWASIADARSLNENVDHLLGRAIRHQRDWASLILLDSRFSSSRIRDKLPKWISEDTEVSETFGSAVKSLGTFYRSKRAS